MLIDFVARHYVQTCNYCHFQQPFIHYDRIMQVHDLIYLVQGSWEIYQEDTPYLMLPGDILCLEAGKHHYGRIPCQPNTKTIFIHLYPAEGDGNAAQSQIELPTLIHSNAHDMQSQFEKIVNIWWNGSDDRDRRCSARVDLLFCDLMQNANQASIAEIWPVNAVHRLFIQHPEKNYTLSELADELHISERSLRYQFFQIAGQSVHQYQLSLKLRMAKHLMLTEPWNSLSNIAHTFGFFDEYHFSKQFKQQYGISPGKFKRNGGNAEETEE